MDPAFDVPFPATEPRGRESELEWIRRTLSDRAAAAVSVVGLGGVGKTTLVAYYAHHFRESYPGGVYWLHGGEDLPRQLAECANRAGLVDQHAATDEAAAAFLESRTEPNRTLIVIDDLDRPNAIHERVVGGMSLARCEADIVITSRFAGLPAADVVKLDLTRLSLEESLRVLANESGRPEILDPSDPQHASGLELCQELDGFPLALKLAGAWLGHHPTKSIEDYLAATRAPLTEPPGAELSVSLDRTLARALEELRSEDARHLFGLLCALPPEQVVPVPMLPFFFGPDGVNRSEKAVAWLENLSLVHVENDEIQLHPLVRAFGARQVTKEVRQELARVAAEAVRARILASSGENSGLETVRPNVFLCYAGPDRGRVDNLYAKLVGDGFSPWMDKKSLLPGQDWRVEIRHAIEGADFFVACVSTAFTERTYGHKEIRLALEVVDTMPQRAIFLIPARLEECAIDDRLAPRHYVNLFEPDGYELLIRAMRPAPS